MSYRRTVERPAFSVIIFIIYEFIFLKYYHLKLQVTDLLLEIAGNLGLWTGFTMMVIGEIFHVFFYISDRQPNENENERVGNGDQASDESNPNDNGNTSDIYETNIDEEFSITVPQPMSSRALNAELMQEFV